MFILGCGMMNQVAMGVLWGEGLASTSGYIVENPAAKGVSGKGIGQR